jgi:4,5-DOPA dioxygenase extradiol
LSVSTIRDIKALINYDQDKHGKLAVPTPDHYIPLIYSMALSNKHDSVRHTYNEMLPGFSNRSFIIEEGT